LIISIFITTDKFVQNVNNQPIPYIGVNNDGYADPKDKENCVSHCF